MPDSDDLAQFLDLVRSDAGQESMTHDPEDCADWRNSCTAHNTLRLAAMVRGVLDGHEPMPTYGPALNPDGTSACGHDPDDGRHFEVSAGELVCQGDPGPPVCARCTDTLFDAGEAEWPEPRRGRLDVPRHGPRVRAYHPGGRRGGG